MCTTTPRHRRRRRRRSLVAGLLVACATLVGAPADAGVDGSIDGSDDGSDAASGPTTAAGTASGTGDAPSGPGTGSPAGTYVTPVTGSVLRLFDPPAVRWGRGHRGVDLAAPDDVVRSPGAGVVTFAGTVVDRGVITVTHPDGLRSSLEPVVAQVPVGTEVAAGDVVAVLGAGSHCPGLACVHWGVRRGETYVDPLGLLGDVVVVLLP